MNVFYIIIKASFPCHYIFCLSLMWYKKKTNGWRYKIFLWRSFHFRFPLFFIAFLCYIIMNAYIHSSIIIHGSIGLYGMVKILNRRFQEDMFVKLLLALSFRKSNGLFVFNTKKLLPTDILSRKLKSLIPFNLTSFLRLFLLKVLPHLQCWIIIKQPRNCWL